MLDARIWSGLRGVVTVGLAAIVLLTAGWGQATVPEGMRRETIADPLLNMPAFDGMEPSKWHFAAWLLQGTSCTPVPFPEFRITSPYGLTHDLNANPNGYLQGNWPRQQVVNGHGTQR